MALVRKVIILFMRRCYMMSEEIEIITFTLVSYVILSHESIL